MRPIHLNLASRPFRDYRPLYAVVVAASIIIAFLMLNNIDTYYRYTRETQTTRTEIQKTENQIDEERRRTEAAQNQIKTMDLVTLGSQTRFINAQLAERAFSWSELLDRLERVVPRDVRITSIAPSFGEGGAVRLSMACQAKTSSGMIETIARLQGSPFFANPFPSSENRTEVGYRFGLSVDYRPSLPRVVMR